MILVDILTKKSLYNRPLCIALGFFDCVHIGHKSLIERTVKMASEMGGKSCVATFTNNPYAVLDKADKLIFTFEERVALLEELKIDCVYVENFNTEIMNTGREKFLDDLFCALPISGVVCGYDYRFGLGASGNAEYLCNYARNKGVMCDVIQPVMLENERVSSTLVRSALVCGDIERAKKLLGHDYFISGEVCHGRGVGHLYCFPTANIEVSNEKMLPREGVYATLTVVDGKEYTSVTNVGGKPTFGVDSVTVESMLVDFSGNLYRKNIATVFVKRLRDIVKFDSPIKLRNQIFNDAGWRKNL